MPHQFVLVDGITYIICGACQAHVGRKLATPGEWAAYDDPGEEVVVSGIPQRALDHTGRPAQVMVAMDRTRALCAPCYLKAFAKRYPGATPPDTLEDRRRVK